MRLIIVSVVVLFITSCISDVEIDLPEYQDLLGVNCILAHSEYARLVVYHSLPATDSSQQENIFDAEVSVTRDDGVLYSFKLSEDSSFYISSTLIEEGYSYSLKIAYNNQILTSETSVPIGVKYASAKHDYGNYYNEYEDGLTDFEIEFDDDPDLTNYYQLFILEEEYEEQIRVRNFYSYYNISDPVIIAESLLEYEPSSFIFSDINSQDSAFHIKLMAEAGHSSYKPWPSDLVLRSISSEYFEFLKSWFIHYYNQNNQQHVDIFDDLDVYRIFFQDQPTPLYSNIEGGIGIFAGYSEYRRSFVTADE